MRLAIWTLVLCSFLQVGIASAETRPPDKDFLACAPLDAETLNSTGILYARGIGVERDPEKALVLFATSASYLYPQAMINLATMYSAGSGARRSYALAYAWLRAAIVFGAQDHVLDVAVARLAVSASRLGRAKLMNAEARARRIVLALAADSVRTRQSAPETIQQCGPRAFAMGQ